MTTHIAFLRAVNLGKRRVKMPHLVELVSGLGHGDVWTHINSGNVVFEATGARAALEHALEATLEDALGFEVTTFVRTAAELRRALAFEPFPVASGDTYFVTFLKDRVPPTKARALEALSNDFDTLAVQGRDVHWLMRGKSTDTKLTTKAWENVVGHHRSTSRNTNMLRRLMDKIETKV
ncbi:MAG: DUF1697 domain-containing protein [Acidimicrobiales bacterium]